MGQLPPLGTRLLCFVLIAADGSVRHVATTIDEALWLESSLTDLLEGVAMPALAGLKAVLTPTPPPVTH